MMAQNSNPGAQGASPACVERVGEIIKREREKRQISVDSIAKTLKLNAKYIEALEASKYDQLPGDTYIRVYLRSLSRFLALDSEEIFRRFFEERGLTGADTLRKDSSTKINLKAQEDKRNNTPVIAIFAAIFLLALFSFFVNRQGCHSSKTGPAGIAAAGTEAREYAKPVADTAALAGRPADTVLSAPRPASSADTLLNARRTESKPGEKHAADSAVRPPQAVKKEPAVSDVKTDTAAKRIAAPSVPAKRDTVKPAARDTNQIKPAVSAAEAGTGTVPVKMQADTGSMVLRMAVVGDSCWGRVLCDGAKDWRNLLLNGKAASFTARDSFNVHIGIGDAVVFTLNGKPLEIPKRKGVVTFKVDQSGGVAVWTLEKWNSIFEKRQ